MSMSDTIADMLAQIKNAQAVGKSVIMLPYSKMKENLLNVLKQEGYIEEYSVSEDNSFKVLNIVLKYINGKPVIKIIKKISKPGRRVYSSIKKINKFYNGLGIVVLSTPKGILSDHEARVQNVGGEVICQVF